jgi:hypothetical protein
MQNGSYSLAREAFNYNAQDVLIDVSIDHILFVDKGSRVR